MPRRCILERLSTEQETDKDENRTVRTKRNYVVQTREDASAEQNEIDDAIQYRITDFSTERFVNRVTDVHGRAVDTARDSANHRTETVKIQTLRHRIRITGQLRGLDVRHRAQKDNRAVE